MKLLRQFMLLALTLLVLVSSTGISVGMHVCDGEVHDISLFGNAKECPMEQQQQTLPPCHAPAADNCCDDQTFVFEQFGDVADTKAQLLTKHLDIKFIAAIKVVLLQLFEQHIALKPAFAHYSSPPLVRDVPVLVQSFLL
ncbi:HYC_CC_PP family protein [Pontibacter sp. 13R65]|uniref:HYC_CC_PP family protein n=1 Tax=Pontibacter sp. 13R65 TaxID=3127458 RepID=UPI00301D2456